MDSVSSSSVKKKIRLRGGLQQKAIGVLVLVGAVFIALLGAAQAASLRVEVIQVRNKAGVVRCGLFDRAERWMKVADAVQGVAAEIAEGRAVCEFLSVPAGQYAVAVFHAENNESDITYGWLGKPKQGVGFSNNPSIAFGPPSFERATVQVSDEGNAITIKLTY